MIESYTQVEAPVEHRLRGEAAGHDCGGVPCLASLPSLGLPAWPGSPLSLFQYFRIPLFPYVSAVLHVEGLLLSEFHVLCCVLV